MQTRFRHRGHIAAVGIPQRTQRFSDTADSFPFSLSTDNLLLDVFDNLKRNVFF